MSRDLVNDAPSELLVLSKARVLMLVSDEEKLWRLVEDGDFPTPTLLNGEKVWGYSAVATALAACGISQLQLDQMLMLPLTRRGSSG